MVSNETWQRVAGAVRAETGVTIAEHGARRIWAAAGTPAKRHGDKLAATVRRIVNNDWTHPAVSVADAEQIARDVAREPEREFGGRVLVRAILPGHLNEARKVALYNLERRLARLYGGFTSYTGRGGWYDKAGAYDIVEPVRIYEVSVGVGRGQEVIAEFEHAGRATGQEWTHITTARETAHHVKTGAA
jgi:hypothetical protein